MPYYNFKCLECNDIREYRVPIGKQPLRCGNDECESAERFVKVYDGQIFSVNSNSGESGRKKIIGILEMPLVTVIGYTKS
ncbi:hypothetical protein COU54_03070 [Candidatus Pacearchaeota archaeon CG10_big_fil_rev_8_21_14_0_10_31_24]|nr:MAG: hypothetical protein COU54_03070 [Candidatus Pacearchaeota archaeon CG10_big_fil_rev_8_21_14_0_10_31_24]